MADNPEDNALVALLESDAMEARAFLDAHNQWMRNPLNRIWFNFIYCRHMILQRLGLKRTLTAHREAPRYATRNAQHL